MSRFKATRFNVSLSDKLFLLLEEYCSDHCLSRSSVISLCLSEHFTRLSYEKQLHDDMSKLISLLEGFERLNTKKLSQHDIKTLDDIKKLCDAIEPKHTI